MKKLLLVFVVVAVAIGVVSAMASGPTTQPGLFFTIKNDCTSPVRGFAVGDKLCLLKIDLATYMRGIFQGVMFAGEQRTGMACAGDDGNGLVLFVPPVSSGAQAVQVTVKPNETVPIPSSFCGAGEKEQAPGSQLKIE